MEDLTEGLADCGLSDAVIADVLNVPSMKERLCLLYGQRQKLMDSLRKAQRKVDILDYLIREMERKER